MRELGEDKICISYYLFFHYYFLCLLLRVAVAYVQNKNNFENIMQRDCVFEEKNA